MVDALGEKNISYIFYLAYMVRISLNDPIKFT